MTSATSSAGRLSAPSPPTEPPRSLTTTLAPSLASSSASPRPTPCPAPVTIATLPSSNPICAPSEPDALVSVTVVGVEWQLPTSEEDRMAVDKSVIGTPTGKSKIVIERGPLSVFARSVTDENPIYQDPRVAKEAG